MAMLTVRNLPQEIHRALRARAATHGHSMEAEVREILESAVSPAGRIKAKLTDQEFSVFEQARDKAPARPVSFE